MTFEIPAILLLALASEPDLNSAAASRSLPPIHFANDVLPILTKLTCNSGNCHGKSGGQNGFRLSLLGFDAADDFDSIVHEGRGRRISVAAPELSLLLRKATGRQAHGGGKLLDPEDESYRVLAEWIAQGAPFGDPKAPTVASLEIAPVEKVMKKGETAALRVHAVYTDGRRVDVTRRAQFQSNDDSIAIVDERGIVTAQQSSGQAAIMARFVGKVAVFRALAPLASGDGPVSPFTPRNYIDHWTSAKWKALGLQPSPEADDVAFLRRVTLDLCGRLPTPGEVRDYLADSSTEKADLLVDRLLDSADYASFQALRFGAVLHNRRGNNPAGALPNHAMTLWLKQAFADDMSYGEIARSIITAKGSPASCPPVVWYRNVRSVEDNVDQVSQMFLGMRVQCARCHHHPYEKWSQDDYYGMASFFARVTRKQVVDPFTSQPTESILVGGQGLARHQRTGQPVPARALDGPAFEASEWADPRAALVDWMLRPDNPFFAKAAVNRIWGQMFSRGIVEPVDDMRVTNPPSNPELLDALAADFIEGGFHIKPLLRTICRSATYRRSSMPIPANASDKQNFARYYARRLSAEVLLDAVDAATGVRSPFGFPKEMRVVDLPDERAESYFLDTFGRPQRATSCECERSNEASLGQALHLLNSREIREKLTARNGRAADIAVRFSDPVDAIEEVYLSTLARRPTADELRAAAQYLAAADNRAAGIEAILWSLVNTREFQFNY